VIHVYGITRAATRLPDGLEGLGEPPGAVRLVTEGELAAIITALDEPPRNRAALERHAQVQSAVAETATVVPLRFGTLMEDERELREDLLARHADELAELLSGVEGCVQMTVKAVYEEDLPVREVVQAHPELKRQHERLTARDDREQHRDEWIALGQRVAAAVEQRRAADEAAIAERLAPHAVEVLVEEPGHERMAARLQLLVRRDSREALDTAVAELADEQAQRLTVRYVGPLAPYSFCDVSLDAGAAAWG
jgi:hypothetical protein